MGLAEFEILLKKTIGLDVNTIGTRSVERAIQRRVEACSLQDWRDYLERVRSSHAEMQALIDAVVVPETWFLRDLPAFTALSRLAVREWLPRHPGQKLRLLSAPCSTGEEPYSMAMSLLDAGFPAAQIRIDAVDVSTQSLARARTAVYTKNSFRSQDLSFRQRHFERKPEGFRVSDRIRRLVKFEQGNLLAEDFLSNAAAYHFVFCRNVLIYFDRPTQEKAIARMELLLAADGVMFVGPAEAGLLTGGSFSPIGAAKSAGFRKHPPVATLPASKPRSAEGPRKKPAALRPDDPAKHRTESVEKSATPCTPSPGNTFGTGFFSRLETASHLADRGHLQDAARLCEMWLKEHGDSAQALYLLGLVRDAGGQFQDAARLFRKALYLDPDHAEALLHLALLTERSGDAEGASLLQSRARRAQSKLKP